MLLRTILLQFLFLYFLPDSQGFLEIQSACKLYELCDIRTYDGKQLPKGLIEKIKEHKERTKQRISNIKLAKALRAEKEKLKWRQKADSYCESSQNKINRILGCENLQMTHENYPYFNELSNSCDILLRTVKNGADFTILIQTIDECERKIHSRNIFFKFQTLRSNLEQRCRLERNRKLALRRANYYEDRARSLRLEANKLGNLIENSLKIEDDKKVTVTLSKDQIDYLLGILEQNEEKNRFELPESDLSNEVVHEEPVNDLNALAEIISQQFKKDITQKTSSSEENQSKPCKKDVSNRCDKSLTLELTKPEIDELLQFLSTKVKEDTPPVMRLKSRDLVGLIKVELETKAKLAESAEEGASRIALELSEDDISTLLNILKSRGGADSEKFKRVYHVHKAENTKQSNEHQKYFIQHPMESEKPKRVFHVQKAETTKQTNEQKNFFIQLPMVQLHAQAHASVTV